jgi:hypothetical protein
MFEFKYKCCEILGFDFGREESKVAEEALARIQGPEVSRYLPCYP